jgi:nucleoside-diphosphate-sugar epimerase
MIARKKFLNLIASAAATGEVLGASPGDRVIRPLHADDIVSAFITATELLLAGEKLGPTHSVSGPEAVTLRELVTIFEQATGSTVPVQWRARPHRPREIMLPWAGAPLPRWSPGIGLAEGLTSVYGQPDA